MTRREWLAAAAAPCFGARPRRPNIVLMVADDLGWGEVGASPADIPMPHIRSIALNGIRFTEGYVSAPVCSPSRAGLLTGRYQTRFGHELNSLGLQNLEYGVGLPVGEKTLADLLKPLGYSTAIVGKWHLGATEPFHPMRRGFDEFFGFLQEGHSYTPPPYKGVVSWLNVEELPGGAKGQLQKANYVFSTALGRTEDDYDDRNPLLRGTTPVQPSGYLTAELAREACAFIDRHAVDPFFLYLAFNAPHCPMQAPLEYMQRFRAIPDIHRRIFVAMTAAMDDAVGAVLAKLRDRGLEGDTLIFFLSDNGGNTRELTSSNGHLRGGKGSLQEGGIRVPFLMQWKGRIGAGQTIGQPVSALDVVPTALSAARALLPANLDGVDLLPLLQGKSRRPPHDDLYWRYGGNAALRAGKWKLLRQPSKAVGAAAALYDLESDSAEAQDVAASHPAIVGKLQARMRAYDAQMVEPLWRPKFNRPHNWPLRLIDEK